MTKVGKYDIMMPVYLEVNGMSSKESLFASQSPPWNDPEDMPMSGNATRPAKKSTSEAEFFPLIRTETLLEIMAAEETSQEDRVKAHEMIKERLQKTGIFAW